MVPDAAWEAELDNVLPDGTRSMESSLRLFAIAFGPVPGVDAPASSGDIASASEAVWRVVAHEDQLTPEQRAVIESDLAAPADAITIVVPPSTATSPAGVPAARFASTRSGVPGPDVTAAIKAAATQFRAVIAGKLGSDIPGPINVVLGGTRKVFGWTMWDFNGPGGSYQGCTVHVEQKATDKEPLVVLNTLAHEIFHCFELAGYASLATFDIAPRWVVEGGAEWVGNVVAAPDGEDHTAWTKYLHVPSTPLFARSYDAMGFFSHLEETGTSPWSVFPAMFKAVASVPAFAASGATGDAFLDSWASGLTRDPARGPGWDTTGPAITDNSAPVEVTRIGNGASAAVLAPAYTNSIYGLSVSADVLAVTTHGHARLSDGRIDTTALADAFFCAKPDGCGVCPDGTPVEVPPAPLQSESVLAATGGPDGVAGSLVGLSMDDFCNRNKSVWVHIERAASTGLDAGTILDLVSCNGPNGTWNGYMALGGITAGAFTVPFAKLPMTFTIGGKGPQTIQTAVTGVVPTALPTLTITVAYQLTIAVDPAARKMSITGTGSGSTGLLEFSDALGPGASNLPIEAAPAGRCP